VGEALEDLLVLGQRGAAGDVDLPHQSLPDRRLSADEAEDDLESRLGPGLPFAGAASGGEHLLTEGLGLLLVGNRKALAEVAEPAMELAVVDAAASEQLLQGHRPVADLPAELEDRRLDTLARKLSARISIGPRPLFWHIDLPPSRNCLVPLREGAAGLENYIPLDGNIAPTRKGGYLGRMKGAPDEVPIVPLGRHGLAPDVVAAHQRERLFKATVELVAKRGYRDTSVDHIVKAARVGYVAFYDLFEDKEACFLAAFDRIVDEAAESLEQSISGEEEWPRQMAAALAHLLEMIAADPQRARIALVEVQAAGPAAYARYEAAVDRAVPKLREGRQLSEEATQLSGTLEEAVLGGVIWIVHQRLVKGELDDTEALLEQAIQIALSPFVGDSEAKRLAEATLRDRSTG